jgi:hypothetical protein
MPEKKRRAEEREEEKEESVNALLRERMEEQEERFKKRESVLEAQLREREKELREKEEELRKKEEELVKYAPTPLWKVLTDVQHRDIFEKHILYELDELSFRVFREVNTESRDAIRRSKRKLEETFEVHFWTGNPPVRTAETKKIEGKQAQYFFCNQAAHSGNLALLRWLREEKKFDWNDWTINAAAEHGHLHIVKYCIEQKCPIQKVTCALAASHGHFSVLKYLHEHGAPWDWRTCFFARKNNHLECLLYALDNGCPNDKHENQ